MIHSLKHILVFMCSLVLLCHSYLHSTQYRVSTLGDITSALSKVRPGDTLTMTNGIWTNANIMFVGYGTASAPILLRAESYGGVVLTGTSMLSISGKNLVVDGLLFRNGHSMAGTAVVQFRGTNGESDSCRLTNSTIQEYNPTDSSIDYKWISLYGTHNRVDHCYLRGKNHQGTTLVVWVDSTKPNYHQIDHNYFAFRPVFPVNGAETIRVGTSDVSMFNSYSIVEYNYFEECNGEIEIISSKSCGNIYRYNTFVSCQGTLTLRHGNRCTVEGNFFFGNHKLNSGGIRIIGEDHKVFNNYVSGMDGSSLKSALTLMDGVVNSPLNEYFQVKRAVVVFNTFVDNKYTMNLGGKGTGTTLPPDSCIIANNVVVATSSPIITLSDNPTNLTWQGNIMYGASLGILQPSGIITSLDPKLSITADGLWRPGALSPVINAAVGSFPFVTSDMDGQLRDAAPDVPPKSMITSVMERGTDRNTLGHDFKLEQNYPNPFNPSTTISFFVGTSGNTSIKIFDTLGRVVANLINEYKQFGSYSVKWNASQYASGLYFCRLTAGNETTMMKMMLVK
jgi:poly(beta-D-mannuronate) lyase